MKSAPLSSFWRRWLRERQDDLVANGVSVDGAKALSSSEVGLRQRLGRIIGKQRAADAQLVDTSDTGQLKAALIGNLQGLSDAQLAAFDRFVLTP